MNYELIRSNRKTIALQIKGDGRIIVRAPLRMAACVFFANGTLRVTVDRTHYEFYDIRRDKIDEMLDWFTKQTDEELKPFRDTRK